MGLYFLLLLTMAKELPYFKFEPNQWENGNIQICNRETKGLFIDLCSMYWSRLGELPEKLAIQKLCGGNATALDSLCEEKIIEVIDGNIFIKFLSEQLEEVEDLSKKNSKNAKEGWEKRRKQKEESERNATASDSLCENDAIRKDKIRIDDINKRLLSELKSSDVDPDFWINANIAQNFQKLFIKNLNEKNASTTHQENAKVGNYVNPIRLMLQNKECTVQDLRDVYDYLESPNGEFWKSNILSTQKLREQITKLVMECRKKKVKKEQFKGDRL